MNYPKLQRKHPRSKSNQVFPWLVLEAFAEKGSVLQQIFTEPLRCALHFFLYPWTKMVSPRGPGPPRFLTRGPRPPHPRIGDFLLRTFSPRKTWASLQNVPKINNQRTASPHQTNLCRYLKSILQWLLHPLLFFLFFNLRQLYFIVFLIEVLLIDNVLISGVQHNDSVRLYIYMYNIYSFSDPFLL